MMGLVVVVGVDREARVGGRRRGTTSDWEEAK